MYARWRGRGPGRLGLVAGAHPTEHSAVPGAANPPDMPGISVTGTAVRRSPEEPAHDVEEDRQYRSGSCQGRAGVSSAGDQQLAADAGLLLDWEKKPEPPVTWLRRKDRNIHTPTYQLNKPMRPGGAWNAATSLATDPLDTRTSPALRLVENHKQRWEQEKVGDYCNYDHQPHQQAECLIGR